MEKPSAVKMLDAVTATGLSERHAPRSAKRTFQATGATSAGAGSAVVDILASNDGVGFLVIGTISLTLGVTSVTDGFASDAPWLYIKADLKTLTGTDATVTVTMGG